MKPPVQTGSSAPKAADASAPAQPAKAVSQITALGQPQSEADFVNLIMAGEDSPEEVSQPAQTVEEGATEEAAPESNGEPTTGELPEGEEAGQADSTEPSPEAQDNADEAPADETGEELQQVKSLTPEQKKHYGKVIADRLREQKEKLAEAHEAALSERAAQHEAQVRELEGQLEELRANRAAANPADLSTLTTVTAVKAKVEQAEAQLEAVTEAIQQLAIDPGGVEEQLRAAKVELPDYEQATMLRWLRSQAGTARAVIKSAPQREQQIALADQSKAALKQMFPWYGRADSKEHQALLETRKAYPAIAREPNGDALLIALSHGLAVLSQQGNAKAAAQAKAKAEPAKLTPPVKPVRAPVAPPASAKNGRSAEALAAQKRVFSGKGEVTDLVTLLEGHLR